MSITKSQAALLFSFDFKLVDKEGNEWSIHNPLEDYGLSIYPTKGGMHDREIIYSQIGTDFFILAHHHSCLTKQVNGVIPLIEIAKVGFVDENWVVENETTVSCMDCDFAYSNGSFKASGYAWKPIHVLNQPALFDKLFSLHFLPHGIEESNVKYINQ